jgi:hypothetical protein
MNKIKGRGPRWLLWETPDFSLKLATITIMLAGLLSNSAIMTQNRDTQFEPIRSMGLWS